MNSKQALFALIVTALASLSGGSALGQTYPVKPVRIIVPAAPGGGVDIMARLLGKELAASLGQQFIVENRSPFIPGVETVAKAAPDGHVLLVTTSTYLVNAAIHKNLSYDPIRDLAPISVLGSTAMIAVVHPSLPVNSLTGLAALAKKNPGALNFGSGGNGSMLHLAGELFKQLAKIDIVHVAYRGTAPAAFDLLAGQVQIMFASMISMHPHIRAGKMRVLAILAPKRSPMLPEVPTSAEARFPELVASIWFGFLTTRNTPKSVVDQLYGEVLKAVRSPEFKDRLLKDNVDPIANSPDEFARFASSELAKWTQVIRTANIKVN